MGRGRQEEEERLTGEGGLGGDERRQRERQTLYCSLDVGIGMTGRRKNLGKE